MPDPAVPIAIASPVAALSTRQTCILIAFGVAGWLGAALLIRFLEPYNVFAGTARLWTYLLIIPGSVPLVWIGRAIAGLAKAQLGIAGAIFTATALLLDGLAVAWIPWLYGSSSAHVLAGAAAILWGAGVLIGLGFVMGRR
jgi:hypothetical protein